MAFFTRKGLAVPELPSPVADDASQTQMPSVAIASPSKTAINEIDNNIAAIIPAAVAPLQTVSVAFQRATATQQMTAPKYADAIAQLATNGAHKTATATVATTTTTAVTIRCPDRANVELLTTTVDDTKVTATVETGSPAVVASASGDNTAEADDDDDDAASRFDYVVDRTYGVEV